MKDHLFSLIIRHNLEQTQDDFSLGDARDFDQEPVDCGTAPDCDCPIPDNSDPAPRIWFRVERIEKTRREWRVVPADDTAVKVFLNSEKTPLTSPRELISGDTLRVGHVTCRFQRAWKKRAAKRKKDYISMLAKISLVIIFTLELGLVFWLPRKLQQSKLLTRNIMSQRVRERIDGLRSRCRQASEASGPSALPELMKNLVAKEVESLSSYVRDQGNRMTTRQWRDMNADLAHLDVLLNDAEDGQLGAVLPKLKDEMAITILLKKGHDKH